MERETTLFGLAAKYTLTYSELDLIKPNDPGLYNFLIYLGSRTGNFSMIMVNFRSRTSKFEAEMQEIGIETLKNILQRGNMSVLHR